MSKPVVHVAVALTINEQGQILFGSRPADKPWAGWWELPGGKIEANETVLEALARELHEEVGIRVTAATRWVEYVHEYSVNIVRLSFCRVTAWEGEPVGLENQELKWLDPAHAMDAGLPMLPAAEPPMRWFQMPEYYALSQAGSNEQASVWLAQLESALQRQPMLVQFREPEWEQRAQQNPAEREALQQVWQQTLLLCHRYKAKCLINSVHPNSWWSQADGVHLRARDAAAYAQQVNTPLLADVPHVDPVLKLPESALLGVSVHNQEELHAAIRLNASFVVIGHVLPTASHPNEPAMGWAQFEALSLAAGRPSYAIGGQSSQSLAAAKTASAQGIAGIRNVLTR